MAFINSVMPYGFGIRIFDLIKWINFIIFIKFQLWHRPFNSFIILLSFDSHFAFRIRIRICNQFNNSHEWANIRNSNASSSFNIQHWWKIFSDYFFCRFHFNDSFALSLVTGLLLYSNPEYAFGIEIIILAWNLTKSRTNVNGWWLSGFKSLFHVDATRDGNRFCVQKLYDYDEGNNIRSWQCLNEWTIVDCWRAHFINMKYYLRKNKQNKCTEDKFINSNSNIVMIRNSHLKKSIVLLHQIIIWIE